MIQNLTISYTGRIEPQNGEAVYLGASSKQWIDNFTGPDRSSRNHVLNNYFGPFVSAESVDIKEGVDNAIVENNIINGTGMDNKNVALTWISVKGFNCTIQNNHGTISVLDGFTVSLF